ncbi:MAG TPA: hypothetical protein PLX35_09435 [Cyclobacteriaceae bacterium]|nr:hypothetical protein [Cyclobacteriaceae bacterium]
MSVRIWLKRLLTGLVYPQEYICLEETPPSNLRLWVESEEAVRDVTDEHVFVGYKPLLIGLFSAPVETGRSVVFHLRSEDGNSVAELIAKTVFHRVFNDRSVIFCEGIRGSHTFIHPIYQWINNQRQWLTRRKPGNVGLPGNLYDQVRIAYAMPRIISVVILSDGQRVNVFPTDLHGPIAPQHYVSSLRIHGKATEQVERLRKLVIADLPVHAYRKVYAWGVNHQRDLQQPDQYQWENSASRHLGIPLLAGTIGYRELELEGSVDWGIHRIHFYKILYNVHTNGQPVTHIHQYYAQWRSDHGLFTGLLFR